MPEVCNGSSSTRLFFGWACVYNKKHIFCIMDIGLSIAAPDNQEDTFGLHQFAQSPNARPDETGVYAIISFEGTFGTLKEAEARSKEMVLEPGVSKFDQFLVVDTGKFKPLSRNTNYTGKVMQVSAEEAANAPCSFNDSVLSDRKDGDIVPVPAAQFGRMTINDPPPENTLTEADGTVPEIVGADGKFVTTPIFVAEDKELQEKKDRLMGNRREKEAEMKNDRAEIKHLLTVGPAGEGNSLTSKWKTELNRLNAQTKAGHLTAADVATRNNIYSDIYDRYVLARSRRATAMAKLYSVSKQRADAVEADRIASEEVVAAHTKHPVLQKMWVSLYVKTLKASGFVLKLDDRYSMLRYITRKEWDETPLQVQEELLENQLDLSHMEQQGIMWKHRHHGQQESDHNSLETMETVSVYEETDK